MGWDFAYDQDKKELVTALTRMWEPSSGTKSVCVKHSLVGQHLWQVRAIVDADDNETERFIMLSLLQCQRGYGWGHKSMDEAMGPNYYDCPLFMLDLVPEPDSAFAREWRRKVRAHHTLKNRRVQLSKTLKVGDKVIFHEGINPPFVTITDIVTLNRGRRRVIGHHLGKKYRIRPGIIARVESE